MAGNSIVESGEILYENVCISNGYVEKYNPVDKAGAYGIQEAAGAFVEKYDGEFDTVVGFNLTLLKKLLKEAVS